MSVRGLVLALLVMVVAGCTIRPVRTYELTATVTNDANQLLVVEGTTSLPEGAPVEAILFDRDGRRLAADQGVVQDSSYFVVLDVRRAPGFVPLTLEVAYDPVIAPAEVREQTGLLGEAMNGEQVEESHGRCRLVERAGVVMVVNTRQAAFREIQGEGSLRELESYIARNPRDAEVMVHLGLAYLKWRPAERRVGSRAHALLQRAVQIDPDTEMSLEARLWLSKLEADQRARAAERAHREALSTGPGGRFSTNSRIVPGEALGEVRLGMPLRALMRRFAPEQIPDLSGPGVVDVRFPAYHDLTVTVDRETSRVLSASSTSDFFRLPAGVGVGSLIQEFYPVYPRIPVVFGEPETLPDGTRVAWGAVRLEGLLLVVERRTEPQFGIPVDRVVEIGVLPPDELPAP
ncbi:MAG: hypothetical protein HY319_00895 [Armatimonadetes bacterium]|nr:hypothetical protein [Armatimonadota bacterium]